MTYKLDELAREAGTSTRTVRYYVQRGLLPAPAFRGKDTSYSREHLVRLKAIRRLQEAFLPLDAIAVELARRSLEELEALAATKDGRAVTKDGAAKDGAADVTKDGPYRSVGERQKEAGEASSAVVRTYQRIELLPGLELAVALDAPDASVRAAERIIEDFFSRPT